jgi:histidine triad (HIT) family protein
MNECIFCRIAAGESPAEIICEDDLIIALADICPIRPGHTLIVPRQHVPYFEDVPGEPLADSSKSRSAYRAR